MPRGTQYRQYLAIIKQNGGKLVSPEATGSQSIIKIRCVLGHEWETQPYRVAGSRRAWCPYCAKRLSKVDVEAKEKECSQCGEWKPFDSFVKDPRKKLGITANCKACRAANSRAFRIKNPERTKQWRASTAECRKYYHENKERIKERRRIKRIENREKITEAARYRRLMDPRHDLLLKMRSRLKECIRKIANGRATSDFNPLISCSLLELKAHFEAQFRDGMTWDNSGEWHADHIIPCAAYKLDSEESKRNCFHFSNLRPLWKEENLSTTWEARRTKREL